MSKPVEGTREQTPEDVQRIALPAPAFAAGDTVPGLSSWLLERKLGGGGFGEAWLARHAWDKEQKPRAVKFCTNPAARHRLITHERNVVVRVMKYAGKHPNIVPLLDCNLDGDVPWLMYEFVEGGTLAEAMKDWRELPMPKRLGRAVRTLHAIAGALAACHRLTPPLVHRDLKPQNVLMAGSVPRITDFGIGGVVMQPKGEAATAGLTTYAAQLPTGLHHHRSGFYAPPEREFGSLPHPHDDVYALGTVAYQMIVGDLKTAPGPDATQELRDLKIPSELASLIVRSVAMNPDRRPKDASEWETTLVAIIGKAKKQPDATDTSGIGSESVVLPEPLKGPSPRTGPPPLPPESPASWPARHEPERAEPPRSRKLLALLVGGVLLLGLAIGIAIALLPSGKRTDPTSPSAKNDPPVVIVPKAGDTCEIEITPDAKMTFCWIPKGECQLGSPKEEQDYVTKTFYYGKRPDYLDSETEAKRGKFKTDGFWMGKYTVTQAEWKAVMGDNPSYFNGTKDNKAKGMNTSRFPVENVNWIRICGSEKYVGKGFLNKINAHGGIEKAFGKPGKFRLPKEDEWEYAARVGRGNEQPFYWGKELNGTQANIDGTFPFGTAEKGTYLERTCAVDATDDTMGHKYAQHPWGLMHMHGNVDQWCEDYYDKKNVSRVLRGGSWRSATFYCRAAYRDDYEPDNCSSYIGFRLVVPGLP